MANVCRTAPGQRCQGGGGGGKEEEEEYIHIYVCCKLSGIDF